jgi:MinD-like ATPase involved in chromosome partitioning or flagellar assembly
MIISVMNYKGGVGKTSISWNLGCFYNLSFRENDPYGSLDLLSGTNTTLNYSNIENNCIYDFAGFTDELTYKVLEKSDVVIVPTLNSLLDVKNTINTINYAKKYCKNIIFVINRYKNGSDITELVDFIKKHTGINQYVVINDSKGVLNAINSKKSIFALSEEKNLNKHTYKSILECFNKLIRKVEECLKN